jgi:hypothetical protein
MPVSPTFARDTSLYSCVVSRQHAPCGLGVTGAHAPLTWHTAAHDAQQRVRADALTRHTP